MKYCIWILLFILSAFAKSQTFEKPVPYEKSHADLIIRSIKTDKEKTKVELSITNRIDGGWFCADKKIYILDKEKNQKYNLIKSEGIPTCPDAHRFKSINETLVFTLIFPVLPTDVKKIDIIEDCPDHCFFLKGIELDNELNNALNLYDRAMSLYMSKKYNEALKYFKQITKEYNHPESEIFKSAISHINVINNKTKK